MKDQWGRAASQSWPSNKPLWTLSVFFISVAVAGTGLWLRYQASTPLQQYWLPTYLSASITPRFGVPISTYRLMLVLHPDGAAYLPNDQDVEPGLTRMPDGCRIPFVLTGNAGRQSRKLILTPPKLWKNTLVEDRLRDTVYQGQTLSDLARVPLLCGLAFLIVGLMAGIPRDKENAQVRKHGRRLRGPEEVSAAEFNRRNKSDGIGFITLESLALSE